MPNAFTTYRHAPFQAINALLNSGAKTATKYLDEKIVVRVSRRSYRRSIGNRSKPLELAVTIGRPNYAARVFIKKAKSAGEPFPIKKVQLTFARAK